VSSAAICIVEQMLAEAAKNGERATPQTGRKNDLVAANDKMPTLPDLGITRDQSTRSLG